MRLNEWLNLVEQINFQYVTTGFDLVDAIHAGREQFGDEALHLAAKHLRRSYATLYNWWSLANNPAYTEAKRLNTEYENYNLTISHVIAVRSLEPENALTILTRAGEQGWSEEFTYGKVVEFKHQNKTKEQHMPERTETPTTHEVVTNGRTYHQQIAATSTALYDGSTQNRADGSDPHYGVVVAEAEPEDVPFTHAHTFTMLDNTTPFDVAEWVVGEKGKEFMDRVVAEYQRWW